jgi:hypothetical protein
LSQKPAQMGIARFRAMLPAQAEYREKADQMRRICGSKAACGSN